MLDWVSELVSEDTRAVSELVSESSRAVSEGGCVTLSSGRPGSEGSRRLGRHHGPRSIMLQAHTTQLTLDESRVWYCSRLD